MKQKQSITFKAKVVFRRPLVKFNEITYSQIREVLKEGDFRVEFISSCYSRDQEPTIIFDQNDITEIG